MSSVIVVAKNQHKCHTRDSMETTVNFVCQRERQFSYSNNLPAVASRCQLAPTKSTLLPYISCAQHAPASRAFVADRTLVPTKLVNRQEWSCPPHLPSQTRRNGPG